MSSAVESEDGRLGGHDRFEGRNGSSVDAGAVAGGRSESSADGVSVAGGARSSSGRPGRLLGGGVDGGGLADRLDVLAARVDGVLDRPGSALAVAAAVIGVAVGAWLLSRPDERPPVESAIPLATAPPTAPAAGPGAPPAGGDGSGPGDGGTSPGSSEATELVVHVAGAVRRPGVVTLDPGARIVDAVDEAGGATAEADLHRLNLAAPVTDGLYIRVPIEGEVVSPVGIPAGTTGGPGAGGGDDGAGPVVDVNRATDTELERLPGIGPALAAAIVEWRSTNGPFATIEELLDVPGIGPAKLAGFADQIVL